MIFEMLRRPDTTGRIALRVNIDEQHFAARGGEVGRKIDCSGGLTNSPLLIRDCVYSRHRLLPYLSSNLANRCKQRPSTGSPTLWKRHCNKCTIEKQQVKKLPSTSANPTNLPRPIRRSKYCPNETASIT